MSSSPIPTGASIKVPAFWDSEKIWKVRYASGVVGEHHFKSECSDASDKGLNGIEGVVRITPYKGDNPLYKHGPLKIAADHRHFEQADGTPFLWLGDSWWMGLSTRLSWPDEFAKLTIDRVAKGFNVVQIVAGLYPDQPAFDPRSANETGFAWEEKYQRIRPQYFDAADKKIFFLADHGIVPCIVGAWGYHLPWLGVAKMKQHLRYVEARWCAASGLLRAGELNLPFYLTPGFPGGGEKQSAQWEEIFKYFRTINAFSRPFTAHPTGIPPLSARLLFKDQSVFDFDMLQTGHGMCEVLTPTVSTVRGSYNAEPPMPVVDGEVTYEALLGRTPAEIPRLMCWACYLSGTAGFTYGANGIWQLNEKGKPYGNSPWGGSYGPIPWDEAMNLPGSKQVGLAAKLLLLASVRKVCPASGTGRICDRHATGAASAQQLDLVSRRRAGSRCSDRGAVLSANLRNSRRQFRRARHALHDRRRQIHRVAERAGSRLRRRLARASRSQQSGKNPASRKKRAHGSR